MIEIWLTDPSGWHDRYEAGEISVTEQRHLRFLDLAREIGIDGEAFESWQVAYVTGLVAATRMFDDTLEFLDAVAHLPIAIVTNVESRYQRDKLAAVGLAERLTQVVGADLVKQAKPDPALPADVFRVTSLREIPALVGAG